MLLTIRRCHDNAVTASVADVATGIPRYTGNGAREVGCPDRGSHWRT